MRQLFGIKRHDTGQATLSGLMFFETITFLKGVRMETKIKYRCKRCHKQVAIKVPNCPECSSSDGYDELKLYWSHALKCYVTIPED